MAFGILSCGAYIPRKRLSRAALFDAVGWAQPSLKARANGTRSFGAWDEDAITMSVEAAGIAKRHCNEMDGVQIDTLCFASTTAPFLDRQNAGVVAAALDMPEATHCFDMSGGQRAGLSGLVNTAKRGESRGGATLVVASAIAGRQKAQV